MNHRILLAVLSTFLALGTSASGSLLVGDAGYVGDFTGVSFTSQANISGSDIGSGWITTSDDRRDWTVQNIGGSNGEVGQRMNSGASAQNFQHGGLAIAVANPGFDGPGMFSFDYDFTDQFTGNGGPGYAFLRIPTGVTSDLSLASLGSFTADGDLSDYEILSLVVEQDNAASYPNRTGSADLSSSSASGTFTETVNFTNAGTDGYVFLVFSSETGDIPWVDNVAMAIPEPSSLLVLVGLLGFLVPFRQRRSLS